METMEKQTHTLETPDVDLVYDVAGPLPTADGQPPLLMAGHPMTAEGFYTVAEHFPDRTVVFYDPRGSAAASARTAGPSAPPTCTRRTCTRSSPRSVALSTSSPVAAVR